MLDELVLFSCELLSETVDAATAIWVFHPTPVKVAMTLHQPTGWNRLESRRGWRFQILTRQALKLKNYFHSHSVLDNRRGL